jgi:hypothetical protein
VNLSPSSLETPQRSRQEARWPSSRSHPQMAFRKQPPRPAWCRALETRSGPSCTFGPRVRVHPDGSKHATVLISESWTVEERPVRD